MKRRTPVFAACIAMAACQATDAAWTDRDPLTGQLLPIQCRDGTLRCHPDEVTCNRERTWCEFGGAAAIVRYWPSDSMPEAENDIGRVYGTGSKDSGMIRINDALSEADRRHTLLHEMLHVLFGSWHP